jgi:sRNA-binding protein
MSSASNYELSPGLWAIHLQHGSALESITDTAHLKAIIANGAEEYIKAYAAYEAEKERVDYFQAQLEALPPTTAPTSTIASTATKVWTPRSPRYTNTCKYRASRGRCRRNQCGYVHEDQVEMYKDVIKTLVYATK